MQCNWKGHAVKLEGACRAIGRGMRIAVKLEGACCDIRKGKLEEDAVKCLTGRRMLKTEGIR